MLVLPPDLCEVSDAWKFGLRDLSTARAFAKRNCYPRIGLRKTEATVLVGGCGYHVHGRMDAAIISFIMNKA